MRIRHTVLLALLTLAWAGCAWAADSSPDLPLRLDLDVDTDKPSIDISWQSASNNNLDHTLVQRRQLGETGKESWQSLGEFGKRTRHFEDTDIEPGIAYEYRISRIYNGENRTGHVVAAVELAAVESRGVALLVVEEALAERIAPRLDRFMLDLTGDGWQVERRDVPRDNRNDPVANLSAARDIRTWVQERYSANPRSEHALILVGRVPVMKSGRSAPDGHTPRPIETDLVYADVDGTWTASSEGNLLHNYIPGDNHIEMQVGRIDFSGLDAAFGTQLELTEAYFDRNHAWRHGLLSVPARAYGGEKNLNVETQSLRNIVGSDNLTRGSHHEEGTQQPWLFGVDFGSWNHEKYMNTAPIETVFSINFGSGKLDFSASNNTLRAMLAQPGYALATGWGGRPAWQLHHMALNRSVGYSHMRTVNNGEVSNGGTASLEYSTTGGYFWVNPIWVNLMGDPTLTAFPLPSVTGLRAGATGEGVVLSWNPEDNGSDLFWQVYRSTNQLGPYVPLTDGLLRDSRYVDTRPVPGAWYMVRAHGLQQVNAGSFYSFSQGEFINADGTAPASLD